MSALQLISKKKMIFVIACFTLSGLFGVLAFVYFVPVLTSTLEAKAILSQHSKDVYRTPFKSGINICSYSADESDWWCVDQYGIFWKFNGLACWNSDDPAPRIIIASSISIIFLIAAFEYPFIEKRAQLVFRSD